MYKSEEVVIVTEDDGSMWISFIGNGHNEGCKEGFHRAGAFCLDEDIINSPAINLVFSQVAVIRCEHNHFQKLFEYHAYSRLFKEIPLSQKPPIYNVIAETRDGKLYGFYFQEPTPLKGLDNAKQ